MVARAPNPRPRRGTCSTPRPARPTGSGSPTG
jgi:hypothetical protein